MFRPYLLMVLLCIQGVLLGQSNTEDPTFYARAGGKKVISQDLIYYIIEIPKDVHKKLSVSREVQGNKVAKLKEVNTDLWLNQEYLSDWIAMVKTQIAQKIGKQPTEEQAFVGLFMGMEKFEKIGFDPEKVTDEVLRIRLDVFKALLNTQVGSESEIPPPLPTDGRKPIPTRYPTEYKNRPRVVLGVQG